MEHSEVARPTIAEVFAAFLKEQEERLAPKSLARYREVIGLLEISLDNYGYQNLRPSYLGGAGRDTSNNAFETGSNFSTPGTANTGGVDSMGNQLNDQFSNNYFMVPNYVAAITDGPTSPDFPATSSTTFIPPPGMGRNSFPGPGYRDVDITVGKAFGFPRMPVLGEHANLEIKANMFNVFNLLNINPSSLSTSVQSSNLGQASSALGARTVDFQARFSF